MHRQTPPPPHRTNTAPADKLLSATISSQLSVFIPITVDEEGIWNYPLDAAVSIVLL